MRTIYHIDSVLTDTDHKNFLQELAESNLVFRQEYRYRLMTGSEHHAWLKQRLQSVIDQVVDDLHLSGEVQQVFLSVELACCDFMMHRAHPNIGAVISWSPEDFGGMTMREWTAGFDDPEDYVWDKQRYPGRDHAFVGNQALVVPNNHEPRFHWGYSSLIGPGQAKQTVWIYLGK